MPISIREEPDGLVFKIRVQPRASKNQIMGIHGDALKIHLTAPPVGNAANKACCTFLADRLSIAKSSVSIVSGQRSRNKQVRIACPSERGPRDRIRMTLMAWAQDATPRR